MADYKNVNTRPVVEAQVAEVLDMARRDETGRNTLFETAAKALGTCGDRVAEGWSAALDVLDSRIAIRDDWPMDKRLECLRGEWLKRHIDWQTNELCKNVRFTDPVEVAIGFKRRLAEEFALPHVMKDMLYPGCAVITDQAMREMRDYLHGLDQTLLVDHVADHPLWAETMKQLQKDALNLIDESFGELVEQAMEVDDFGSEQKLTSPVIQTLYDHTPNKGEWNNATVKEIGEAKEYARRLFYLEHAEAALALTTTRRETAAPEASSSSSQAAPRHAAPSFNPPGGPQDGEAAERRKARLGCLQAFALEQVAKASRGSYEKFDEKLYEKLTSTPLTDNDLNQIRRATGAANPTYVWAKLDQIHNNAAPVGRLANEDRTFIFAPDSATPHSRNVKVILAPAAALRERAAELDAVIAENESKQPKDRKKVSFTCESGAERREQKMKRPL
jgi:hypothetical protein